MFEGSVGSCPKRGERILHATVLTVAGVVRKASELRPDILGLSVLLRVAAEGMKATVAAVRDADDRIGTLPVTIGGGIANEQTCVGKGADLWASNARGVQLIREAIAAARG